MMRTYHKAPAPRRASPWRGLLTVLCFALAILGFFGGIVWFRQSGEDSVPVDEEPLSDEPTIPGAPGEAPRLRDREEISLRDSAGTGVAVASREVEDYIFRHTVVAHLPPTGESYFYEGWLVREEPFGFFSTGEMVLNEDGTYALVWEGEKGDDFFDYTQVVITAELRDGDPAPATHVLEGEFE